MSDIGFTLTKGEAGLHSLLHRAQGLDPRASVRLRPGQEDIIDVFVSTPFEVLASRRVRGELNQPGVLSIDSALAGGGPDISFSWTGALPPETGFELLDTIPVTVVRELADQGQALARQFAGPLGPPRNLLEQTVLTVSAHECSVEIPMRLIFGCTALGFIPSIGAPAAVPRYLRVSQVGRWTRVDAAYGSVYLSRGLPLLF